MNTPGQFNTQTSDMIAVHQALLGSLDAAPDLVGKAGVDPDRVEIISSFYDNVLEFLHVHHAGEDEMIYPLLEERCAHEKALLERIDDQHKLLYEPMDGAWATIAAWRASPSAEGGQAVVEAISTVDTTLRPHLKEEEDTVLPIASAWMSPEEWSQLPGHALQSFRGDKPWLALGLVREGLTSEQRDGMLAGMPPPLRSQWTDEWEPAFAAFIAEVRR
ncbi:MAG: hemerythrin domain-containing protein [Acidimicrobiales bacterium]|jgi:hemerythrin-like domain-containing protein